MSLTDERLATVIAYVDGELTAAEAQRFEAEVAGDPALAAEVARHRALAGRVSAAYAPVLDQALPPQLLAVAAAANDRAAAPPASRLAPWAAAAAALVVGVVAGRIAWPQSGPVESRDGALVARGRLASALSTELADQDGVVKVGLTLKAPDGRYCRTFRSTPDRLAGLACREAGRWRVRTLTAWTPVVAPAYRQAASDTPPEVLAAVDALGAQPLDAVQEKAARDAGWK